MKVDKKFIDYLRTKTIDGEGYPLPNEKGAVVAVADLRRILFHLEFINKEPYRANRDEEVVQSSIGLLGE